MVRLCATSVHIDLLTKGLFDAVWEGSCCTGFNHMNQLGADTSCSIQRTVITTCRTYALLQSLQR
jgi:hypothetical protein